jgi:predicted RNase H-like HicB family nuclease
MTDIPVNIELGEHGLYYGTSPALRGLLVIGDSVEQVRERIPAALEELRSVAAEGPAAMTDKPDFEKLRALRNEALGKMIEAFAAERGIAPSQVRTSFNPNACYCACPGGPCEHDFQGWREITDDEGRVCGGETVCARCGMGALSHSMRVGP